MEVEMEVEMEMESQGRKKFLKIYTKKENSYALVQLMLLPKLWNNCIFHANMLKQAVFQRTLREIRFMSWINLGLLLIEKMIVLWVKGQFVKLPDSWVAASSLVGDKDGPSLRVSMMGFNSFCDRGKWADCASTPLCCRQAFHTENRSVSLCNS